MTTDTASSGRRSFSSSVISTREAANAITSTLQPVTPIHWAALRVPGSVPIGYPAPPQGNPPKGNRDFTSSHSDHAPTATNHHRIGAHSRTPYITRA